MTIWNFIGYCYFALFFSLIFYLFYGFSRLLDEFDKSSKSLRQAQNRLFHTRASGIAMKYELIRDLRNLEEWKVRYYPRMESPFSKDIAFLHKRRTERIDRRNLIKLAIKEAYKSGCHGSFDLAEEEARRIHNNIFLNS